jgi:hypothetical protein
MRRQDQEGGDSSTNVQVGRDVVVQGISLTQAVSLFQDNFLVLQGIARDTARARAEEITTEFLSQLEEHAPESLRRTVDPDFQASLLAAQVGYARSGDEDLRATLVPLLIDRAGRDTGELATIVLNEAIEVAPKLTPDQTHAIALCSFLRYTSWTLTGSETTLDDFYSVYVEGQLLPFASGLPRNPAAFQHIEYVGAGRLSNLGGIGFFELFAPPENFQAWRTHGFAADEVPETSRALLDDASVFMPALRDPERLQVRARDNRTLDELLSRVTEQQAVDLRELYTKGTLTNGELAAEALERVPGLSSLAQAREDTSIRELLLTSVGLAIGHSYRTRLTGTASPLDFYFTDVGEVATASE